LHRVGHTGDDEPQRREGNGADANQDESSEEIAKLRHVKNVACKQKLEKNSGKHKDVIGDNAGGKHVAGRDRRYVEATQNALFPEHDESRAESPETAHNREGNDRPKEKFDDNGLTFGEDAGIEKEKSKRHEH